VSQWSIEGLLVLSMHKMKAFWKKGLGQRFFFCLFVFFSSSRRLVSENIAASLIIKPVTQNIFWETKCFIQCTTCGQSDLELSIAFMVENPLLMKGRCVFARLLICCAYADKKISLFFLLYFLSYKPSLWNVCCSQAQVCVL